MRRCAHPELVKEFQMYLSNLADIYPYIDQEVRETISDALDTVYDMIFPPESPASEHSKGFLLRFWDWIHGR